MENFERLSSKEKLEELKTFFKGSLTGKHPLLKMTLDDGWLDVEYLNIKNYMPSDDPARSYNYKLLASQDLGEYKTLLDIVNRITIRLADELTSRNQDINGILSDYNLVKKPLFEEVQK